jgi:hypothetical protein
MMGRVTNTLNAAADLQKNDPTFRAKVSELQMLAKQGKTAANDPTAARLTQETTQMIHDRAKKMAK